MSGSTFLQHKFRSASLFGRLLILLLATVLATQGVTFALVLATPTPAPPSIGLADLAAALRTGADATGQLRIAYGDAPDDNWSDPTETRVTQRLAFTLNVRLGDVRYVAVRAGRSGRPVRAGPDEIDTSIGPLPSGGGPGKGRGLAADMMSADRDTINGQFEAGLRMADGRWRVASLKGIIAKWQWEVLLWLLGSTMVVAPFAWFFARRIANPIAAFGDVARELGRNPRAKPVTIAGPPEIRSALEALNDMQQQLTRYVEDRTTMVGAIAHDLRTPLMRLALRLEKAPDDIRISSERDIAEIEGMATAALSFVRDLTVTESRRRIALRSLVETVADEFADRGADVSLEPGEDVILLADLNGLKRMLTNVAGNAVTYGGNARIAIDVGDKAVTIAIADDGPGIPLAEQDRVFEPFYRVEQSRNRNTGGTGLGLASARAVARAHGGDIILGNRPFRGLLATISLPL